MREILFRGKTEEEGKWLEGDLFCNKSRRYIRYPEQETYYTHDKVLSETVGQYTGLTDKNGKKIFEGDIVKAQDDVFGSPFCDGIVGKVVYDETAFFIETANIIDTQYLFNECAVYEVIGNIHDNPELLKGE